MRAAALLVLVCAACEPTFDPPHIGDPCDPKDDRCVDSFCDTTTDTGGPNFSPRCAAACHGPTLPPPGKCELAPCCQVGGVAGEGAASPPHCLVVPQRLNRDPSDVALFVCDAPVCGRATFARWQLCGYGGGLVTGPTAFEHDAKDDEGKPIIRSGVSPDCARNHGAEAADRLVAHGDHAWHSLDEAAFCAAWRGLLERESFASDYSF